MIGSIRQYLQKKIAASTEKPVVEAYDLWSGSYDHQPGNLMLDLDEQLFTALIKDIHLTNKRVADIGCGTGRHWQQLYALKPRLILGLDVSGGMLAGLKQKFPNALTQQITDNLLHTVPDAFADCVVTTLTIAHIKNIEEAIAAWCRITKQNGDLVITDFHPDMLARGGKRSFQHNGATMSVINYVHPIKKLLRIFSKHGFLLVRHLEKRVDESVKSYYESQNAVSVYERFKGMPVIYGLHLKRENAPE